MTQRQSGLKSHARRPASPSVALALGGGGARGLAHILILEALDELGVTPKVIAGTSIGAIFGAAYASGMSGLEIRKHTKDVFKRRLNLLRDVFSARTRSARMSWNVFSGRRALLEADALLDVVLPDAVARTFENLKIPLHLVASDFYALEARVLSDGPLRPAIGASMALPVIFNPVTIGGRTLMDGGFVNPLAFDVLDGMADILIAIDVSGSTAESKDGTPPTMLETLFAISYIFERSLIREKLKARQPDIYIRAGTDSYRALDFLKVDQILKTAEPVKDRFKVQLSRAMEATPVTDLHDKAG